MSFSKTSVRRVGWGLALGAGALLAGCAGGPNLQEAARSRQLLPTEQYGVTVSNTPETISLGLHASGLSPTQQAALGVFVSRWRENGGGAVTLRAPNGGDADGRHMQAAAAAYIVKLGVPRERLVLADYASPGPDAPLVASYDRFDASGPNCSVPWGDLDSTFHNRVYGHFGCAVTANIAAQVANPRDFLAPAVETPADNSRRQVVLGKYREGLITSSAKDDQANGKVSDAASQ